MAGRFSLAMGTSLDAIKMSKTGDIYCVFQPHTYTRTKLLFNNFSEAFGDADKIIITDIYAAREKNNGIIHSRDLSNALKIKATLTDSLCKGINFIFLGHP